MPVATEPHDARPIWVFARLRASLLPVAFMVGCHAPSNTAAPDSPSVEPAPQRAATQADETPAAATEDPLPVWWTPLPSVSLDPLSDAEQRAARACAKTISGSDASPSDLLAAAECLGENRAYGLELRVLRQLLHDHPSAEEAPAVHVAIGRRFEQLDRRADALDAYARYLKTFPKHDDARALGERAVCLARSLGDTRTVEALLQDLQRLYGRRGFVTPPNIAFEQLCAGLAPVG